MKFIVTDEIFERFPHTAIGIIVISNITNFASNDRTNKLLAEQESRIRSSLQKESFTELSTFQNWRKAYREFGVKPSDGKSSVENLYRLVLSGRDIRRVSVLVDLYNYVSLKYTLPVGGEDLDKCVGDIKLCVAGEGESPVVLLGDDKEAAPNKGEVIYKDSISAICRRWNWREADRTKLTEQTKNCILVIEGIAQEESSNVSDALGELGELVKAENGGEQVLHCLTTTKREAELLG